MPETRPGWRLRLRAAVLAAGCLLAWPFVAEAAAAEPEPPRLVGFTNIPKLTVSLSVLESNWLAQQHEITVGVVPNDFVPFDLLGLNNEYEGISADYLDAVAAALGLPVRVEVFRTRQEARQALGQGRVDILPTVPSWLGGQDVSLSAPYVPLRHVEVTSRDRRIERGGGINVGYIEGHVSLEVLRQAYPQAQLIPYGSAFLGVAAMSANKLDAFVDLGMTLAYLVDHYQLTNLRLTNFAESAPAAMHFAYRAGDIMLPRLVDRALGALPQRVRAEVRMRWSPTSESTELLERVSFSEAERQWMAAHPVVRWAPVADFMPFLFVDHRGRHAGLALQVIDKIESETGLRFEPGLASATGPSGVDILPAVMRGQPLPAGMQTSDPYFRDHWVIVARSGDADVPRLSQLAGKRIAYFAPNSVAELIRQKVPDVVPVLADSVAATYELVAAGKADVTIGNIDTVNYILRQFYPERLKVAGAVDDAPVDIAFAVRSSEPELLSIINKTLASIPPEEMRRVRANGMFFSRPAADWAGYVRWLSVFGAVLAAFLLLFVLWNRSLKKQVERRLAAEAELHDQLNFQRAMLEGMPHAIAVRDAKARLLYCNSAYERLFQVARQTVIGKTLPDNVADSNLPAARAVHEQYLRLVADGNVINEDLDLDIGGNWRRVLHWAAPIARKPDGERVALVSGVIDMTERHHLVELIESARAKAEAANRAKSNFLATMSHEIRTPMNAVMGVLELLVREGRLASQDRESADLARNSARSLLSLIDDILDISKIEAGGLEVVPRPAQLRPIVQEVANVFQSLARQRGLRITVEIDERLARWHAVDAARFRQIVNNLVSNAIKYTDTGGVTIALSGQGVSDELESILLEITDTGIGIAPEDVQNLFKPFFQAEAAGPRTVGGTGLGLPIVQRLCMRMGGDISVTSQRGVGTSISVALRLVVLPTPEEDDAAEMEEGTPAEPLAERERYNILVVDDHPANRLLMQRQLGFLGFRCNTAEDGKVALDLWQKEHFDVVITDCSMPVMDGYALTSAIRAIEREKKLPPCPVLGCTAHVQERERRKALDVGMDECLMKPLSVDALLEALRRHLSDEVADGGEPVKGEEGSGAPEGAAFDRSSLKEFSGGDAKLEASFLEAMLRTNLSDMEELQSLIQSGASREVASCAHKIKGAARIVRAERVVHDCEAVEAASNGGDAPGLAAAFADLQQSLGEFNEAMSRQLQVYASLAH